MIKKIGVWVVGAGCAYELVALTSGKIPTITRISWRLREHPAGAFAVWAGLGVLSYHLLLEKNI